MPNVILRTPIPQIELAIAGKIDFLKKTNPWGSGEEDAEAKRLAEAPSGPEAAAAAQQQLVALVARKQRQANRDGKRRRK